MTKQYTLQNLLEIMQQLRDPHSGCSWDQVQTFQTIAPYTIEEAYEIADAIARNEMPDLCDELGDLLFQVVYHAQMAAEQKSFVFDDVVNAICNKMIRRHPHVFGSEAEKQRGKQDWEQAKQQERIAKGVADDSSALANIALGLPPLQRARKLQTKAARIGFDWTQLVDVMAKLTEELNELEAEVHLPQNQRRIEDEIGDVLFTVVNISRHVKVDADIALQKSNSKFEQRFRMMEALTEQSGERLESLNEERLDELWEQAKQTIREQ